MTKKTIKIITKLLINITGLALLSVIVFNNVLKYIVIRDYSSNEISRIMFYTIAITLIIYATIYMYLTVIKKFIKNIIDIINNEIKREKEEKEKQNENHRIGLIAFDLMKNILINISEENQDELKKYMNNELYSVYKEKIRTKNLKGEKRVVNDFKFIQTKSLERNFQEDIESIDIQIEMEFIDYLMDKDNKKVRGSKFKRANVIYLITMYRTINTKESICPNCGAKINNIECEYCKTSINNINNNYKVSHFDVLRYRVGE